MVQLQVINDITEQGSFCCLTVHFLASIFILMLNIRYHFHFPNRERLKGPKISPSRFRLLILERKPFLGDLYFYLLIQTWLNESEGEGKGM